MRRVSTSSHCDKLTVRGPAAGNRVICVQEGVDASESAHGELYVLYSMQERRLGDADPVFSSPGFSAPASVTTLQARAYVRVCARERAAHTHASATCKCTSWPQCLRACHPNPCMGMSMREQCGHSPTYASASASRHVRTSIKLLRQAAHGKRNLRTRHVSPFPTPPSAGTPPFFHRSARTQHLIL